MTRLEHAVTIRRPLAAVYALCKQVERYPEFLPGYRESRIVSRNPESLLLERAAEMRGRLYRWISWVRFQENQAIHFEQASGPLRGMRVDWQFYGVTPFETRVVIIHQFHRTSPWGIGFFMERFYFKPRVNAIAHLVVKALKGVCESHNPEVVSV